MNLDDAFKSVDMGEVFDGMCYYAYNRLKSYNLKDFSGKAPEDFVGEVLLKVVEGTRDWAKAKCTFKEFLFGSLRSEINNYFKSPRVLLTHEIPERIADDDISNVEEERKKISEILQSAGADDEELTIFECWIDGIIKPAEICADLGIKPEEAYVIIKRLNRRLSKVRNQIKDIL